jgi:hypothetical protein
MERFTDRTVLVTGGGSGIGFAVAKRLLDEGACVIISGRNEKRLDDAVERLGGERALAVNVKGVFFTVQKALPRPGRCIGVCRSLRSTRPASGRAQSRPHSGRRPGGAWDQGELHQPRIHRHRDVPGGHPRSRGRDARRRAGPAGRARASGPGRRRCGLPGLRRRLLHHRPGPGGGRRPARLGSRRYRGSPGRPSPANGPRGSSAGLGREPAGWKRVWRSTQPILAEWLGERVRSGRSAKPTCQGVEGVLAETPVPRGVLWTVMSVNPWSCSAAAMGLVTRSPLDGPAAS